MMVQPGHPQYAEQLQQQAALAAIRNELHADLLDRIQQHNTQKAGNGHDAI